MALGHGHEEVEQSRARRPRLVHEQEAPAGRPRQRALRNPGDSRGCNARVDGVAARAQHVGSGLGRERVSGC